MRLVRIPFFSFGIGIPAALGWLCAAMTWPLAAQAGRPMVTDDARIVDAGACQLETWSQHSAGSTQWWALPACNPGGSLELTMGGAVSDAEGHRSTDVIVQGKMLLKPLQTDGWGLGMAAGAVRHAQGSGFDGFINLPASISLRDDAVVVHANLGWLHEGESRRNRLTWGLGTEAQLAECTWLIAETFGQNQGNPFHQIGLRHWLVPDRVQFDATYGNRNGGGTGERWFSLGLRLLSRPFLR